MNSYLSLKVVYTPIVLSVIYLLLTIFLYSFGPWDWNTQNKFATYSYLLIYIFSLSFGYFIAIKNNITFFSKNQISKVSNKMKFFLVSIGSLIVLFNLIAVIRNVGLSSFSFNDILNQISLGITDPASQYYQKLSIDKSNIYGGSLYSLVTVLISPMTWAFFPIYIFLFRKINIKLKLFGLLVVASECIKWIAIATNKGIFDLLIIFIAILLLTRIQNNNKSKITNKPLISIVFMLVTMSSVWFFISNISDRIKGNYRALQFNTNIDYDSVLFDILPNTLHPLIIFLTSYITQGYYAFSISIGLVFPNNFGFGSSLFLQENFSPFIGSSFFAETYQNQLIGYGWDPKVNWHTFYVWLGNDVPFIFIPIIMFVIGYLFAITWTDAVQVKSFISIILLPFWFILIFYIPANNQIGQSPYFYIPFSFWLMCFLIFRKRKLKRIVL